MASSIGRGAVDMKGEIACFVAAAKRYLDAGGGKVPGSISLLITGDEEGDSVNGTIKVLDWLKARGEVLHACVVGEPSSRHAVGDEIKIGRRGSLNGDLIVEGKQGHAAYPHIADNPVPKLARIIDRLSNLKLDNGTSHFEPSHLVVTVISVPNTATNVIPAQARARFNVRYNDAHQRPTLEAVLRKSLREGGRRGRRTLHALVLRHRRCVRDGGRARWSKLCRLQCKRSTGRTPKLSTTGGTSDARFIKDHCPVIELGLLNATIHQVDECVPVADLETLTKIYERFIALFFARA